MSYKIYRFNGQQIATVQDGTIDTSLDIKLIGKSYAGYGIAQNENFVYLLENFANTAAPPNPLSGQIWFDSGNNKLKFYDGSKFRTTGGAEIGPTAPTGLTVGDFWFDTVNKQLFSWNGTGYTLIGPQGVAGQATTQMQSVSVRDSLGGTHAIIQAVASGNVIFTVSSDPDFILDGTANPIPGFTTIRQGITLTGSNNEAQPGVTANSSHRFYGTATNAEQLGGFSAASYVKTGNAKFDQQVTFSDTGFQVGDPISKLKVFNSGATTPTIQNVIPNTPTQFQTTTGASVTVTPLQLLNYDVLPGVNGSSNLGSSTLKWANIYANYVYSTASAADTLNVLGSYAQASIANVTGSVTLVARDTTGTINVTYMNGIAQKADKLLYNNNYLSGDQASNPNTVVTRDASANIFANVANIASVTKTGTNGNGDIGQVGNKFATVYANTFSGALSGNVTGDVLGNVKGNLLASDNSTLIDNTSKTFNGTINSSAGRILAGDGSAVNPSIAFNSDGAKDTGFYWGGDGYIRVSNNGVYAAEFAPGGDFTVVGDMFATVFHGTATSANYADLAEKYLADADYEVGTVVAVGGEKEVTATKWGDRAIGAVSANPAYMMNSGLEGGTYIALKGRVPVKVTGAVKKGQRMVAGNDGTAVAAVPHANDVFAIALESNDDTGVKLVECIIL